MGNRATVWAYSLDGYSRGEMLSNGGVQPGDLRFETVYRYRLPAALRDLVLLGSGHLGLAALMALMLFLPGLAMLSLVAPAGLGGRVAGRDPAVRLGLALAASLICLPLAWLWMSQAGGRWSGVSLWSGVVVAELLILLHRRRPAPPRRPLRLSWETMALAGVLALGLAVRLVAIRDLVLPAWVDSPQHYLISRMMAESGVVPENYRPWMPVDRFWYHFGYHALTASLQMMGGGAIERIMLVGGQILNGLAPLSVYTGTVLLTGRRRAGVIAAFWVALPALFPAYFVSWGRYTQLSGLLILAPLIGLGYRFFARVGERSFIATFQRVLPMGLLLGGLFTVHSRVWIYAMVWMAVAAAGARRPGSSGGLGRPAVWWGAIMAVAAGLAAPWLVRVWRLVLLPMLSQAGALGSAGSYNAVQWAYLNFGWERAWYALAGAGLLWGLWRRRRPVLLLGAWVVGVLALINLADLWLVNNDTWLISLFVPVGMIIGWFLDDSWRLLGRRGLPRWLVLCGSTAAVICCALFGVRQGAGVVNVETVLARPDDLALIDATAALLPADALVAVNGWQWLGESNWAGPDGGYWLMPLTGLQSTMPPIGYGFENENRQRVNAFYDELLQVEDWLSAETLSLFRERGVTHIFIGERGGALRPEALVNSPHYRLLDSNGAAWLFELRYAG